MKILTNVFLLLGAVLFIGTGIAGVAYASTDDDLKAACAQANNVPSYCADIGAKTDPISGTDGIIIQIANVIAFIAGIVAVIMVIYGGFRYIISNGDPSKITNARLTITYALVGIVVVVLARAIIVFILNRVI